MRDARELPEWIQREAEDYVRAERRRELRTIAAVALAIVAGGALVARLAALALA